LRYRRLVLFGNGLDISVLQVASYEPNYPLDIRSLLSCADSV